MENWVIWFLVAGVFAILEMFTGSFYLLMLASGIAAGGAAALLGLAFPMQFVIAGIVGIVATGLLRRTKLGNAESGKASRNPDINMDIGQHLTVDEWKGSPDNWTARAMYRGAMWDVELEEGAIATPGSCVIREIRGSRLIVVNDALPIV